MFHICINKSINQSINQQPNQLYLYLDEEYSVLSPAISSSSEGWKGFIYMAHAVIDTAAAWTEVNSLTG